MRGSGATLPFRGAGNLRTYILLCNNIYTIIRVCNNLVVDPNQANFFLSRRTLLKLGTAAVGASVMGLGNPSFGLASPGRVPQPSGWLVGRWRTDPWARGAYAALPAGVPQKVRWQIAERIIERRVAIAGEFCDWAYPGTVQGALRSGRQAATLLDEDGVGVSGRRALVVGAGVAGLGAATKLRDQGAEVTILEARDRVGGRIHTDLSWGTPIELGATWIHGVSKNPMVPITRSAGLTLAPSDYSFDTRSIETGTYAPTALKVRADLYDYLSEIEDADPALRWSVAEWLRKEKWDATEPEKSWALNTLITQEYSVDADVLGTHAYLEGKDDRGGDAFVLGGFQRAPETLANDLDVRLNSAVDLVSANKRGVVVRESNGKLWKADIVVVAVPHALLKAGSPRITDLPKKTRRAVAQLRTGNLERVVLRFEEQWWKSFDVTAQGIGLVGARWSEWYDVSANTGVPTLLGFCGGRAAEGMPASDQAAASEAMNELSRGFAR